MLHLYAEKEEPGFQKIAYGTCKKVNSQGKNPPPPSYQAATPPSLRGSEPPPTAGPPISSKTKLCGSCWRSTWRVADNFGEGIPHGESVHLLGQIGTFLSLRSATLCRRTHRRSNAFYRVRINFENMLRLAHDDRTLEKTSAEVRLSELRHLWNRLDGLGMDVTLFNHEELGRGEQNMPGHVLQLRMPEDALDCNGGPSTATLLTDAGYPEGTGFHSTLEHMQKRRWRIEILQCGRIPAANGYASAGKSTVSSWRWTISRDWLNRRRIRRPVGSSMKRSAKRPTSRPSMASRQDYAALAGIGRKEDVSVAWVVRHAVRKIVWSHKEAVEPKLPPASNIAPVSRVGPP